MNKFVNFTEISEFLGGKSRTTIDRYRKQYWTEGVHYSMAGGSPTYNLELIRDWWANFHDPTAHQRAIDNYVASLPCNQPKRRKSN